MTTTTILLGLGVLIGVPLIALLVIVGADVALGTYYGSEGTISGTMRALGQRWPMVPFIFGFITGGFVCGLAAHFWAGF